MPAAAGPPGGSNPKRPTGRSRRSANATCPTALNRPAQKPPKPAHAHGLASVAVLGGATCYFIAFWIFLALIGMLPTVGGMNLELFSPDSLFSPIQGRSNFPTSGAYRAYQRDKYTKVTGRDLDFTSDYRREFHTMTEKVDLARSNLEGAVNTPVLNAKDDLFQGSPLARQYKELKHKYVSDHGRTFEQEIDKRIQELRDAGKEVPSRAKVAANVNSNMHNKVRHAKNRAELPETDKRSAKNRAKKALHGRPGRRAQEVINGTLPVEPSDVGRRRSPALTHAIVASSHTLHDCTRRLALTPEEATPATTCSACDAQLLPGEVASTNPTLGSHCCRQGKVVLDIVKCPDSKLTQLWHATTSLGRTLRKFARPINNALAMASQVVCEPRNAPGRGGWNPSYVIQGKLHHCMGPLYPSEGTSKAFAQTYMNDPAMGDVAPLDLRMGRIYLPANTSKPDKKRVRELLDIFGQAICEHNPYVNDFVQASQLTGKGDKKAKIVINADARPAPPDGDVPASSHERRYNPPSTYKGLHGNQTYGEVSVLMPDADVGGRDVVVQFHGGGIRRIYETHRSFDPLHFVLLFPAGDDGWKINMKKNGTQQSITPCDYYAYRIQSVACQR